MDRRKCLKVIGLGGLGLMIPKLSKANKDVPRQHIRSEGDIVEMYLRINGREYAAGGLLDAPKKKNRVDHIGMLAESCQRKARQVYKLVDENGEEIED